MRALILALVALPLAVAWPQAPAGFSTVNHAATGYSWYAPRAYTDVPLPPTEGTLIAKYVSKALPSVLKRAVRSLREGEKYRPEIVMFAFGPEARTTDAANNDESSGPSTLREAMVQRNRVHDQSEFQQRYLGNFTVKPVEGKPLEFTLESKPPNPQAPLGYMITEKDGADTIGVVGITLKDHLPRMSSELRTMLKGFERGEAGASRAEAAALDRLYRSGTYRAVDQRKKVRLALSKGWKAIDTENYIIVHHSNDEKLVNKIARDMEAMQAFYAEMFPAAKAIEAVSIVRICRTQGEYHYYGGRPGTGGYFHPGNEELVLYDYGETQKQKSFAGEDSGRRISDKDTLLVLYHEAFHQYVYYAVGQVSPHDWFNEGHGDYFSGAKIADYGTKVSSIGPSSWRIHRAKDQCELGQGFVPLETLLKAERPEFYAPQNAGNYYAAAWSFIYFLRESEEVQKRPDWAGIPTRYYETMKEVYGEEMKLRNAPSLAEKQQAGERAKKRALAAALKDVNIPELEAAWKEYVARMKDPWPHLRQKR